MSAFVTKRVARGDWAMASGPKSDASRISRRRCSRGGGSSCFGASSSRSGSHFMRSTICA
jgi:hypothetical protein